MYLNILSLGDVGGGGLQEEDGFCRDGVPKLSGVFPEEDRGDLLLFNNCMNYMNISVHLLNDKSMITLFGILKNRVK